MTLRALLLCCVLTACTTAPVEPAQAQDRDSYAAADVAAIHTEADALDLDQLMERMEAIRDTLWGDARPTLPQQTTMTIEMVTTGGTSSRDTSLIMWRDLAGAWEWRRALYNASGSMPETEGGRVGSVHAFELERQLGSEERRAEIWYSPASTPLRDGGGVDACENGPSTLLLIRRTGEPDEVVVQSCKLRWRNGNLITLLNGRFGRG